MVEELPTSFPTNLDNFVDPTSSSPLSSPSHSEQHTNVNDAVRALQEKVGVDNSTDPNSLDYKIANFEGGGSQAYYQADPPEDPNVGEIWIESDSELDTYSETLFARETFTATSGQTVFTLTDPFLIEREQVYLNGVLLKRTDDYTTPDENTVTLTTGAAEDDILEVIAITPLNAITLNFKDILDDGQAVTPSESINFIGATIEDDPVNNRTNITVRTSTIFGGQAATVFGLSTISGGNAA